MKKWFFLVLGSAIFIISCNKANTCNFTDLTVSAATAEKDSLAHILSNSGITAMQHPSGFYYTIDNYGTGTTTATVCSTISVNYTGSLLANGHIFETDSSTAGVSFVLGQAIAAWQKGVPLIKSGGSITLYIPPSLAYGAGVRLDEHGNVAIPANAYLKFIIILKDVQ